MERTIYERADGDSVARLSAPAASQRPNCSSFLPRGLCAPRAAKAAQRVATLPWRWLLLVPHVGSIDDGLQGPVLWLRLLSFLDY